MSYPPQNIDKIVWNWGWMKLNFDQKLLIEVILSIRWRYSPYQPNTCWQCQLWHDYLCWWLCKCSQRHGSPPFKLCNLCKTLRFVVLLVVNLSIKVSQTDESLFAVVLAKALNSRARFAFGNVCTWISQKSRWRAVIFEKKLLHLKKRIYRQFLEKNGGTGQANSFVRKGEKKHIFRTNF